MIHLALRAVAFVGGPLHGRRETLYGRRWRATCPTMRAGHDYLAHDYADGTVAYYAIVGETQGGELVAVEVKE